MSDINNIASILNAINEINTKPKKKLDKLTFQNPVSTINQNSNLPPDVDKLIREAEEYRKFSVIPLKATSLQKQPKGPQDEDVIILTDEKVNYSESKDQKIADLNIKIKKLENSEIKLIAHIEQLKKNKALQSNNAITITEPTISYNFINNTKENLKSIYKQVEEQKKLFLDLENHSIKIERDSNVYKENYERLIIENNELKTKLRIAKEQIVNYETNKTNLLLALDQLNEILAKSNIVGKISPQKSLLEENNLEKKGTKTETID